MFTSRGGNFESRGGEFKSKGGNFESRGGEFKSRGGEFTSNPLPVQRYTEEFIRLLALTQMNAKLKRK